MTESAEEKIPGGETPSPPSPEPAEAGKAEPEPCAFPEAPPPPAAADAATETDEAPGAAAAAPPEETPPAPLPSPADSAGEAPSPALPAPPPRRRRGKLFDAPGRIVAARLWRRARWILVLPPLFFLGLFLFTSKGRIYFPYELEWFEGHIALQAWRVAQGLPQYPDLESGWATYSYPPLFFWVTGGAMKVFGFSLIPGRVISLIATFLTAFGTAMIVWDHTRRRLAAALGGLILFAWYKPSGFWFDLCRVDMLAQALLAWGAYWALKRRRRPWEEALGLLLLALAPLAKQTVAPVSAVVFLLAFLRHWRLSRYALLAGLIVVVNLAAFVMFTGQDAKKTPGARAATAATDTPRRLYQYLVENPRRHTFFWNRVHPEGIEHRSLARQFLQSPFGTAADYARRFYAKPPEVWDAYYRHLLLPAGLALAWAVFSLARWRRMRGGLWLLFWPALLYGSLASWAMIGGFSNNFIPGFCGAAVVFGLAAGGIERLLPRRWMRVYFDLLLFAALILQLTGPQFLKAAIRAPFLPGAQLSVAARAQSPLLYAPRDQWPAPGSAERGDEIVRWIAGQKDPVYAPHHPYLMVLAGREPFYTVDAVRDWNYSGRQTPEALLKALREGAYPILLLDGELAYEWLPNGMREILEKQYRKKGPVVTYRDHRELLPVTGALMRPNFVFEYKNDGK